MLDLGASCGRLAHDLAKRFDIKFTGVDTCPQKIKYIPIKKYDGIRLPFRDNSFDCVMIIDVLHHDENPERIIMEAMRVSRSEILIKDHFWNNRLDFYLLKFEDYIGNKPYGIYLPYNFLTMKMWLDIFSKNKLKIISSSKFRYALLDPGKHVIFQLEK